MAATFADGRGAAGRGGRSLDAGNWLAPQPDGRAVAARGHVGGQRVSASASARSALAHLRQDGSGGGGRVAVFGQGGIDQALRWRQVMPTPAAGSVSIASASRDPLLDQVGRGAQVADPDGQPDEAGLGVLARGAHRRSRPRRRHGADGAGAVLWCSPRRHASDRVAWASRWVMLMRWGASRSMGDSVPARPGKGRAERGFGPARAVRRGHRGGWGRLGRGTRDDAGRRSGGDACLQPAPARCGRPCGIGGQPRSARRRWAASRRTAWRSAPRGGAGRVGGGLGHQNLTPVASGRPGSRGLDGRPSSAIKPRTTAAARRRGGRRPVPLASLRPAPRAHHSTPP